MTQEEFLRLQSDHQRSGLSLKSYLQQTGTSYSTYNYWRKKFSSKEEPSRDLAPLSSRQPVSSSSSFSAEMSSGATLLFPNGLRAHFGGGTEDVLRELLYKSLCPFLNFTIVHLTRAMTKSNSKQIYRTHFKFCLKSLSILSEKPFNLVRKPQNKYLLLQLL